MRTLINIVFIFIAIALLVAIFMAGKRIKDGFWHNPCDHQVGEPLSCNYLEKHHVQ